MNEEKREFWGLTPASIISATGFLLATIPCAIKNLQKIPTQVSMILAAIGILLIVVGIVMNVRKGLHVKWRKINVVIQIFMIIIIIIIMKIFFF